MLRGVGAGGGAAVGDVADVAEIREDGETPPNGELAEHVELGEARRVVERAGLDALAGQLALDLIGAPRPVEAE